MDPNRKSYKNFLKTLSDSEFENERYTLLNERRFLSISDEEVEERIGDCDSEASRRTQVRLSS